MDDILASIRRILNEDEAAAQSAEVEKPSSPKAPAAEKPEAPPSPNASPPEFTPPANGAAARGTFGARACRIDLRHAGHATHAGRFGAADGYG